MTRELDDQYNKSTSFSGENIEFEIMLREQPANLNLDNYYYMDSKHARTTMVAGQTANVYEFPNGICDGPSCSKPSVAIVSLYNQNFYHIMFTGDAVLSDIESQILSTFRFLDNNTQGR